MKKNCLLLIALMLVSVFYASALTQVSSTLNLGSVLYMTNGTVDAGGVLLDQKVIDDLEAAGYEITKGYPATGGVVNANELNAYDVVIVGRNVKSGDFLSDNWVDVEAPVLALSAYTVTNSKFKLINATSAKREVDNADSSNMARITKAQVEEDFVFNGVPVVDGKMDYMTWFYDYLAFGADSFATKNNGKLLAQIVDAEKAAANGNVLMARWEPGKETYVGSGVTPKGYRSYLQMGADDKSDPKRYNYAQYTDASFQLLLNEINFLIRTGKKVSYFVKPGTVDANGVLYDQKVMDDLKAAGYTQLTQTYPADGGAINKVELNKSDLIVLGRNVSSGDFKLAADWAAVEAPVLVLSGYLARNTQLKLINSATVKREVDNADSSKINRITKALVASETDSAFFGVAVDGGKMDYMTWFYDYIACGIDTFATTNNGKLLASIVDAEKAAANGNVLMARWEAGKETYTGSGITPAGYRTYLQMGGDDKSATKVYNYAQYTDASFKLMLNEMSYLASTYTVPTYEVSSDATLDTLYVSAGTLDPAFDPAVYSYSVVLPAGTTEVPTVAYATANDSATVEETLATAVPGQTLIRVTAEDEVTILTYLVSFKLEGGSQDGVVEPGMGTLEDAVLAAESGDTLILKNGGVYDIIMPITIDKTITIIAQEIPELPALANMPVISNLFTSTTVFDLNTDCDLTLIGIDVDGLGGSFIFDPMAASAQTINLYVNRCRLHNTIDDILNDDGSHTNNIILGNLYIRNTFIYDNGTGHGIYTKNFHTNGSDWKFENITMWNLGQQLTWIKVFGEGQTQNVVFDHMTGYNLSTSVADNKEIIGNDEKVVDVDVAEAALNIKFKNNILSTQVSTNPGSLIFKNTDGFHDITINNNVFHSIMPLGNIGTVTVSNNLDAVDPQFADAANGDFTVGNADLYAAADDGKIVGAVYWHPDFVDDFSDVDLGNSVFESKQTMQNVSVYPNPFNSQVSLSIELTSGSTVSMSIFNISGQLVKTIEFGELSSGSHTIDFNANELNAGIYFYQVQTNTEVGTGKMVKN